MGVGSGNWKKLVQIPEQGIIGHHIPDPDPQHWSYRQANVTIVSGCPDKLTFARPSKTSEFQQSHFNTKGRCLYPEFQP